MEKKTLWKMLDQVESGIRYEVYSDIQGNKFFYEDGKLEHTEIYDKEESKKHHIGIYDLSGEVI